MMLTKALSKLKKSQSKPREKREAAEQVKEKDNNKSMPVDLHQNDLKKSTTRSAATVERKEQEATPVYMSPPAPSMNRSSSADLSQPDLTRYDSMTRSMYEDMSSTLSPSDLNINNRRSLQRTSNYMKRPISASTYGMRRSLLTGPILYENTVGEELTTNNMDLPNDVCADCGQTSEANMKLGDVYVCESCAQKRWQIEVEELVRIKTYMENSVEELKAYLNAKKKQCNENVRNSYQIKRFINMTMQQIKRKVELELENKRDELIHSIDNFVDNQKKISSSVNDDTFQTSDKICNQIESLILESEEEMNLLKIRSVKTFARSYIQRLNQQKGNRVPLYSIYFVPDSTIEVKNSFGKLVLKSFDTTRNKTSDGLLESDDDDHLTINGDNTDPFNDMAYFKNGGLQHTSDLNSLSGSQTYLPSSSSQYHFRPSSYTSRWLSSDNVSTNTDRSSARTDTNTKDTNVWLNKNLNQYLSSDSSQFKNIKSMGDIEESLTEENVSTQRGVTVATQEDGSNLVNHQANQQRDSEVIIAEETSLASKPFVPGKILIQSGSILDRVVPENKGVKLTSSPEIGNSNLKSSNSSTSGDFEVANINSGSASSSSSSPSFNSSTSQPDIANQKQSGSFKKQILQQQTQSGNKEKITNF